jgi:hypothetical protein
LKGLVEEAEDVVDNEDTLFCVIGSSSVCEGVLVGMGWI